MKPSRKKRTPPLDLGKLQEVKSQNRSADKLRALSSYLSLLEKMKDEQSLNAQFISLEALARITAARIEGYEESNILGSCPDSWGHSGSHTPQSMHSSGSMTSMFSPS